MNPTGSVALEGVQRNISVLESYAARAFIFLWDHLDYQEVSCGMVVSWLITRYKLIIKSEAILSLWSFWSIKKKKRWQAGQIQSDWTDPTPEKIIPPLLFINCYGLIRSSKLRNKEQEWMADFPSRDVICWVPASFGLVQYNLSWQQGE